jgi:hypothetical protein
MFNLEATILVSLKILFVYGAMKEGMILFKLRQFFDLILSPLPANIRLSLMHPLYNCLFCMSSFWGIIFTLYHFELSFAYLFFLLQIAGINYLLSLIIPDDEIE